MVVILLLNTKQIQSTADSRLWIFSQAECGDDRRLLPKPAVLRRSCSTGTLSLSRCIKSSGHWSFETGCNTCQSLLIPPASIDPNLMGHPVWGNRAHSWYWKKRTSSRVKNDRVLAYLDTGDLEHACTEWCCQCRITKGESVRRRSCETGWFDGWKKNKTN